MRWYCNLEDRVTAVCRIRIGSIEAQLRLETGMQFNILESKYLLLMAYVLQKLCPHGARIGSLKTSVG